MAGGNSDGPFISKRGQTDPPTRDGGWTAVLPRLRRHQLFASAATGQRPCAGQGRPTGPNSRRAAQGQLASFKTLAIRQFSAGRLVILRDADEAGKADHVQQKLQPCGHWTLYSGNIRITVSPKTNYRSCTNGRAGTSWLHSCRQGGSAVSIFSPDPSNALFRSTIKEKARSDRCGLLADRASRVSSRTMAD